MVAETKIFIRSLEFPITRDQNARPRRAFLVAFKRAGFTHKHARKVRWMASTWDYEVDLPGGMTHTIQVQSDSPAADFNLRVLNADGEVMVEDTGPESGAHCLLTTDRSETHVLQIELVRGEAGFSLNVSSSPAEPTTPVDVLAGQSGQVGRANEATKSECTPTEIQGLLDAHNRWRAKLRGGTVEVVGRACQIRSGLGVHPGRAGNANAAPVAQ